MISVCMATYNGAKYIKQQMDSILSQLSDDDEVIVSDDGSTDGTLDIMESYHDKRIKVFHHTPDRGPIGNFEYALTLASGDYLFLADQDDIWVDGRVKEFMKVLESGEWECVICNRNKIDKDGNVFLKEVAKSDFTKDSFFDVLIHNPYIGCCMAFTRKHLDYCLPFPKNIAMHDIWIGLIAHLLGDVKFIPTPYHLYRRHGENTTPNHKYPIIHRIRYRIRFIIELRRRFKERNLKKKRK